VAGRVELFEMIRPDRRREQLSIRALADRHRVHRRTVRQALASAVPPPRKSYPRPSPAIGPWMGVIDEWLIADKEVPRKQRHTARRIWQRLGAEHGVRYDNLTSAVVRVLRGRGRQETERFIALRSHYGFDSFFAARVRKEVMKRVAWKARSGGSAAVIWCRYRRLIRWPS
jgi:hypothetical protein